MLYAHLHWWCLRVLPVLTDRSRNLYTNISTSSDWYMLVLAYSEQTDAINNEQRMQLSHSFIPDVSVQSKLESAWCNVVYQFITLSLRQIRWNFPVALLRNTWNLLNIWEFVYFVWGLSPPKRRVVRWRNFARTRVPTMCWLYVYRDRRYENNDIFLKLRACRPRLLLRWPQAMGRSVGP